MTGQHIRQQSWSAIFGVLDGNTTAATPPDPRQPRSHSQRRSRSKAELETEDLVRRNAEGLRASMHCGYPGDAKNGADEVSAAALARGYRAAKKSPIFKALQSTPQVSALLKEKPAAKTAKTSNFMGEMWEQCQMLSSQPTPSRSSSTCDRCDGRHATESCPHFSKPREQHKDAWAHYGAKRPQLGASRGVLYKRNGQCIRQPADGSCLFHSLCYGLNSQSGQRLRASELRKQLAGFIEQNPELDIAGDSIEEWVRWDSNSSAFSYARKMASSGWGGGLEMAACSHLKGVDIHVYERSGAGFKRISCFDCPTRDKSQIVNVLYQGGVHYDALIFD